MHAVEMPCVPIVISYKEDQTATGAALWTETTWQSVISWYMKILSVISIRYVSS